MKRNFMVALSVDEEKYMKETDGNIGIGDYLESKMKSLAGDGISMQQWMITDDDDPLEMQRYINDIFEWAFAHSSDESPCSAPTFEEWKALHHNEDDVSNCKKVKRVLRIPKKEIERYNRLMQADQVDYEANSISNYSTVRRWTVDFGNGLEMDLNVTSEEMGEPLWCQAVLFLNNFEVSCSEVQNNLNGVWKLYHDSTTFILEVCAD